ncbi:hypothetical protein [Altererythrobacter aquiaggeris]|uniref:hypothetical protein n=1 Tax=Aestuarierythrobacter aquiaggeris TaxID=1898396 RepID=UPI003016FEA0
MNVPVLGPDGVRRTVNANLTPMQVTWNTRSALNVAALNCLRPEHAAILPNYTTFLKTHSAQLSAANRDVTREFRDQHGAGYRDIQDGYMTQVYNYFALPPAQAAFCDAALKVSNEAALTAKGDLHPFAARNLPLLESVFDDFYRAFELYKVDVAAWDAQYGTPVYGVPTYGVQPVGDGGRTYVSAPYSAPTTSAPSSSPPVNMVSIPVVEATDGSSTGIPVDDPNAGDQASVISGPVVQAIPGQILPVSGPVIQQLPGQVVSDAGMRTGQSEQDANGPVPVDSISNPAPAVSGPVIQPLPENDGAE